MAFARGKFGIEYNPAPRREEPGPLVPLVLALVFAGAFVSLVWTVYGRLKGDSVEKAQAAAAREEARLAADEAEKRRAAEAEKSVSLAGVSAVAPAVPKSAAGTLRERPVKVRNLLRRLEEAEEKNDVEMAATTIELLRSLPGRPAADLDDALARQLGRLNLQRLFTMRSPLWTVDVTVGRGDSASRLAYEHGSTLASLARLNPKTDLEHLRIGQKLKVMNHPTFRLLVTKSSRTAELLLNGKFFKRYYLTGPVTGETGSYELPERSRTFWPAAGLVMRREDRAELETLMPRASAVVISDY